MADATTVRFRFATTADIDEVVALVESAYRGTTSRVGWTTEADLLGGQRTDADEIGGVIADPKAKMILRLREERLVGCILARLEEGQGYLGMFAIRPMEQGSGLGKELLAEAEQTLRRKFGARTARLTVIRQRAELIGWYERRGYRLTGQTEPFPYDNPRFGLPRRADLEFVVLAKSLE